MLYLTELLHRGRDLVAALHRDEDGQGAVEYVGIIIVVVAIIAIVAQAAPEVGGAISSGLQSTVQGLTGGG
jgi:Flp pilus assembly pilin Flp